MAATQQSMKQAEVLFKRIDELREMERGLDNANWKLGVFQSNNTVYFEDDSVLRIMAKRECERRISEMYSQLVALGYEPPTTGI